MVRRLIVLLAFSAISASILAAVRGISYSLMLFSGEGGKPTPPPYVPSEIGKPVKFRCIKTPSEGGSAKLKYEHVGLHSTSVSFSEDGNVWTVVPSTSVTFLLHVGAVVYFRASSENTTFWHSIDRYSRFSCSDSGSEFEVSGDIMTLLNPTSPSDTISHANCFRDLFSWIPMVSAPLLSARNLTTDCYLNLFAGCSKLRSVETMQTSFLGCANWLSGVSSTGTFICPSALGSDSTIQRGASACPTGWSVVNK